MNAAASSLRLNRCQTISGRIGPSKCWIVSTMPSPNRAGLAGAGQAEAQARLHRADLDALPEHRDPRLRCDRQRERQRGQRDGQDECQPARPDRRRSDGASPRSSPSQGYILARSARAAAAA
jgi:hypothetical protein